VKSLFLVFFGNILIYFRYPVLHYKSTS